MEQIWRRVDKSFTVSNMTTRRYGAASRTRALSKAADAVARRDAARIEREKSRHAALADFFQAQEAVERINADAAKAAEPYEAAIRTAVYTLNRLDETRAGIAELTGLSTARVREYLAAAGEDPGPAADDRPGCVGSTTTSPAVDSMPTAAPVSV